MISIFLPNALNQLVIDTHITPPMTPIEVMPHRGEACPRIEFLSLFYSGIMLLPRLNFALSLSHFIILAVHPLTVALPAVIDALIYN